jgi:serine protease Do
MNTRPLPFFTAGFAAIMAIPASALEAPVDDAPPPPAVRDGAAALPEIRLKPEANIVPKAAAPFLGVISGDMPDILAEHLALEPGQGIVVRSLVPDGPAAKAGLQVTDLITRVGGKPVGSPMALSKEVLALKPGDTVTLDIIHKGKASKVDVQLGTKPAELAAAELQPMQQLDLEGLPKEFADRIRDAIAGNVGGIDLRQGADADALPLEMKNAVEEMQKRMQGAFEEALSEPDAPQEIKGEATIRMNDNDGSVEVKSKDGAKEVTVRDHQNNIIWTGPWDTPQDKLAAPAGVRERVQSLNLDTDFKGGGLRLRMRGQEAPQD